jgi:uncharacterized protein (TIGR03437 family)
VEVQVLRYCGEAGELKSNIEKFTAQTTTPEFVYLKNNADGKNPVAAHDSLTYAWTGPAGLLPGVTTTPAKANQYLTVYGVGFGATDPNFDPGQPATGIARVTGTVQVTIAGTTLKPEDISYVGTSPGYAGLYQVNFKLPAGLPAGDQPIVITVSGNASPVKAYLTIAP